MDAKKQRLSDIEITHMLSMILHIPEISLFIQTPPELIFNIIHDE